KLQNRVASYLEQSVVPAAVAEKRSANWSGAARALVLGMVILGIGVFLFSQFANEWAGSEEEFDWSSAFSLVVLPFEQSSAETEAIAAGLSDVVMQQLTQKRSCALNPVCETLKVSSSSGTEDIPEIAREHDVNYVLRGNIQREGQVVQIRTRLLRADNSTVWSKNYRRTFNDGDLFSLQSEVANSIAELSSVWLGFDLLKLHAAEHPALQSVSLVARDLFLKALEQEILVNTGEGGDDRVLMRNYLEKAIEADSAFAIAYLLLSENYTYRYGGMSLGEATTGALNNIEKAIQLNPTDPQNLLLAGQVHLLMTLDYRKAGELLGQGMDQYPDRGWFPAQLAMIALREGRTRTALNLMSTAEKIPFGFEQGNFQYNYAWLLLLSGYYDRSLAESSFGLELVSGGSARADLLWTRWTALIELDRLEEARSPIEEGWALEGTVIPEAYVAAFANIGEERRAGEILAGVQPALANQYYLATGYLSLGDREGALKAIDAAIEDHSGLMADSLKFDKVWDPLRCEPEFIRSLERLEQMETLTEAGEQARAARNLEESGCD
ncbi:MAG: hypothetical protein O7F71_21965, partial [Gammaproteobacteria bacterium]|nr:hypothetical protein [Gammaproteobacteria bacterium]